MYIIPFWQNKKNQFVFRKCHWKVVNTFFDRVTTGGLHKKKRIELKSYLLNWYVCITHAY